MLKGAGWTDKRADRFLYNKDGTKLGFVLMYPSSDSLRKEVALATHSDLAKIGVDAQVQGFGWDEIRKRIVTDANVFGMGVPYDPDFDLYKFHSKFIEDDDYFSNVAHIRNKDIDAALEAEHTETDPTKRNEAMKKFQAALREDASMLYTVRLKHVVVVSNRITGVDPQFEPHAHGVSRGTFWNLEKWSFAA